MSRKILGLDIRSASATAVLLETGFKTCAIAGFGHAPFPGEGSYHERLSASLAAICGDMDLRDSVCALSLPASRFFYRNVSVPFSETKKIHQMLPYELESLMALPVEELLIDFNKVPLPGPEGETRLIAAGIETEALKTILDTVEGCGIKPDVVFPGGCAQSLWIKSNLPPKDAQLYIDIDGSNGTLYLLLSGEISLIRPLPLPPSQAPSAIHLWGMVQQSIAGFESLFETRVTPELITVNTDFDEKLPKQLETVSGITVEPLRLELPEQCSPPDDMEEAFSPRSDFNGALSNAVFLFEGYKGMNLRKGPLAAKNRIFEYRQRIIRTAVFAGVLFLVWLASALVEIHVTQKKVDTLQAEIKEIYTAHFPGSRSMEFPAHQMQSEIDRLKSTLGSGDVGTQMRAIDLLRDISDSIPDSIDFKVLKFQFSDGDISMDCTTTSYNLVNDIKSRVEAIESVSSATSTNATREDGGTIRFGLKIKTKGGNA